MNNQKLLEVKNIFEAAGAYQCDAIKKYVEQGGDRILLYCY